MIKLIQALQPSPQSLQSLVKDHLNNDDITEFVSTRDILAKVNLLLQRIDDVPFFMKYVFRIVRQPQPSEIIILKGYLEVSRDESIKRLVECLLEYQQRIQKQNSITYLEKLSKFVQINNDKEFKAMLQQSPEPGYSPCIELFVFANSIGEDNVWKKNQYKLKMLKYMDLAFDCLQKFPQSIQLYVSVLAKLYVKNFTTKLDDFSLMVLLIQTSTKYPQIIRKIIQNWQKSIISQIPCHILSSAIFSYYISLFDHQIYFKETLTEVVELKNLCQQVYDLIKSDFSFQQLGWISIFSIDKWITSDISEDGLYKCIAFLRENYFYRSDIISQILVLNISRILNQPFFKFLPTYETLLSILTPKQLKYLIFKLDQTLEINVKQQIILSAVREKTQNLCVLAFYFAESSQISKLTLQQANQLKATQIDNLIDVADNIKKSSYNSFQKQIINFKDIYRFWLCFELNCLDNKPNIKTSSYTAFFKDLFMNDYFAEEFWVCEEKISIFLNNKQPYQQKMDAIFDFLLHEKINNLSGIMILNQLLREGVNVGYNFSIKQLMFLQTCIDYCLKILRRQFFISNVTIILDYLLFISELPISIEANESILNYFKNEKRKDYYKMNHYTKISYSSEAIIINLLQKIHKLSQLQKYSQHTGFFTMNIQFVEGPRQYRQKIAKLYHINRIKFDQRFDLKQLVAYKEARKLILTQMHPQYLKATISKIIEIFQFHSPLYNGQIVVLTHLAKSPQQNYYFRNHYIPFVYKEYAKLYVLAAEKVKDEEVHLAIFNCALDLLNQVLKGDTFSHGLQFYKSLNKSQLIYTILSNKILQHLNNQQLQQIVHVCLRIIQKDNYPLLRQYISVTFCRTYLLIVKRDPESQLREQLIDMMRVNINIGVPIALTLGYELIQSLKAPPQNEQVLLEIQSIHELLVKFISCHTAYLRAICQYYLYLYLDIVDPKDQFLTNLKHFWKDDKDSQKILTNVSIVVQGFKEGVQQQCDFLGFQRVEQYPTNRLKMEFYSSTAKFYSEFIMNQYSQKDFSSQDLYGAINQATTQRYVNLKANYLLQLQSFTTNQAERTSKSNIKKSFKQKKNQPVNKKKPKKEENKIKKVKNKQKTAENPKQPIKEIQLKDLPKFKIQTNCRLLQSKQQLSRWYRSNVDPKIIVIATLLEKVHNFGHILRTLHGKKAMVVVPSVQPLLHPECKQLVPSDCDVEIVEIRRRDLEKFIILMKSLGYPLVALQQCSRSVMVQQANFPQKFMMLLGNQRIGAPSALLNQGDLLVQIPQIGKIRSLNVHVSMVICLWQFLNR